MSGSISGAPNLKVIDAITQFVGGTQAVWNNVTIPVPSGLVVYATDTTAVKIGDGQTLYANLPVIFTLNDVIVQAQQIAQLTALVTQLPSTGNLTGLATLDSPDFTGTPTAPTPSPGDNSTKVATTAYIDLALAQLSLQVAAGITPTQLQTAITTALSAVVATQQPLMDGVAAIGVSSLLARQDHVHPVDTSRARAAPYTWDVSAPPPQPLNLPAGETAVVTFSGVKSIPLGITTVQGLYQVTLVVTATNTVNSDWELRPNNATYANAISQYNQAPADAVLSSFGSSTTTSGWTGLTTYPYLGDIPHMGVAKTDRFIFDLFYGPTGVDPINDIGPCLQEFLICTTTRSKMVKSSAGITGGPSSSFQIWTDTVTPWTSLGTLVDASSGAIAATVTGMVIIKRLA